MHLKIGHSVLALVLLVSVANADDLNFAIPDRIIWSEPREFYECVKRRKDQEKYVVSDKINPFYLRVDLDGETDGFEELLEEVVEAFKEKEIEMPMFLKQIVGDADPLKPSGALGL